MSGIRSFLKKRGIHEAQSIKKSLKMASSPADTRIGQTTKIIQRTEAVCMLFLAGAHKREIQSCAIHHLPSVFRLGG